MTKGYEPGDIQKSVEETQSKGNQESQQFKSLPTIYNLRELIERCFTEARQAGFIRVTTGRILSKLPPSELRVHEERLGNIQAQIIADERKLAEHIALTIVGELREFEILRKLAPMFRVFRQLENDFIELDAASAEEFRRRNLRREPQESDL